jgi:type IV secretion system protein VirB3/type IV secretion system protein VirB4
MRTVPIRQSLHRHNQVFGAERELVMFSALIAFLVGVGGLTLISGVAALLFWICALFVLRAMAKSDPVMSKVWLRHINQQDYYPARASRWRSQGGFKC